jgi:alkylhydroperoxidase family enzyme
VGRKAALSDEKLRAVADADLSPFDDTEKLVIELADALSDTPSNVSDALYARLRARFSEEQLIELGAQIGWEQYRARFNRLFDVGSDGLYTQQSSG